MTLFDLLFLLTVLVTLVALVRSATLALTGRGAAALRGLRTVGFGWVGYLGLGLAVSAAQPQRVLSAGAPWCFDDWCLTLDRLTGAQDGTQVTYTAALHISSRARRVRQRANGAWIYLMDAAHHRYGPEGGPDEVPLDVELGPGDVVATTRRFVLPAGNPPIGLITGHGSPYCGMMNFLIIGEAGCVFGKPAMIRVPAAG